MTWMLATKRNFLIIVNFRDCFSIKLFISIRLSMPSASPKKIQHLCSSNITCKYPKSWPRVCTFRCAQSHTLCYFYATTWRPQIATFSMSSPPYRCRFPFPTYSDIIGYKIIHNDSLFAPHTYLQNNTNNNGSSKKMLKSVQLWSHFLYGDFTNTHNPEKVVLLSSS